MSDKPFTPIAEQIALLERRGMSTDTDTASILLREGYYQVVNGYKSPFLDTAASSAAKDDRYRRGVSFNDLYSLFRFDRDLRETTFHYLLRVEALVRTVCSYTFAEAARRPLEEAQLAGLFAPETRKAAFATLLCPRLTWSTRVLCAFKFNNFRQPFDNASATTHARLRGAVQR